MRILAPIDRSVRDGIVLPYCVRMAEDREASIVVVQVLPVTRSVVPGAMRQAEAYVIAAAEGVREQGLTAEAIVRKGDPAAVIVALADELPADLIVMATRGRSGLEKFVLGSVAGGVLANSQKPVLLLSEAAKRTHVDEETRRQSAYLASVIWDRQSRGIFTGDQAERELERLAASGLDGKVLFATYGAYADQGAHLDWLDIDFQVNTLREFFPTDVLTFKSEEQPQFPSERAA